MPRTLVQRHVWRLVACGGLLSLFLALGCGDEPAPAPPRSRYTYDKDGYPTVDLVRPANPPNLIVLLLDTLRADAVALPGQPNQTYMPFVSKLAAEGVSFSNATSPAPWTLPSITSMLTGVMPYEHRVDRAHGSATLSGSYTTFSEVMRNAYGYETLGFAAGPWFDRRSSVWQGFRAQRGGFAMAGARPILKDFVSKLDRSQPYFLLLHSFEAHDPYGKENHPYPKLNDMQGPPGFNAAEVKDIKQQAFYYLTDRARRRALNRTWGDRLSREVMKYLQAGYKQDPDVEMAAKLHDAYFEGVRWVDTLVEKTVALLHEWHLLDDTLLVIVSDHGEAFGEHGTLEHGIQLYDELIHVPLIMIDYRKDPAKQRFRGGRVFHGATATMDLLPTFFDYAGMRQIDDLHASSFFDRIVADDRTSGAPVYSEERMVMNNSVRQTDLQMVSVRTSRWKYILNYDKLLGTVVEELYDLHADPGEKDDLAYGVDFATIALDEELCVAIEGARDAIWEQVAGVDRRAGGPYSHGGPRLSASSRPAPCGSKVTK